VDRKIPLLKQPLGSTGIPLGRAILARRKARATTAINVWLPVSHIRAENMCTRATTRINLSPWNGSQLMH